MEPTETHVSKPCQRAKKKWKKNFVRDFTAVSAELASKASVGDRHQEQATKSSRILEDCTSVLFQSFNETRAQLKRIESKFEEQIGLLEARLTKMEGRSRFRSSDVWPGRGDTIANSILTAEMSEEERTAVIMRAREEHRDQVQNLIESRIEGFRQQGKGTHDLTLEERNTIDEDFLMQEYAKSQIQDSKSNEEFLTKVELLIEEEWLNHVDELPGNMFYVGAFGDFAHGLSYFNLTRSIKFFMCVLVVMIQVFGPPLIFLSSMPGNLGARDGEKYDWRCLPIRAFGIYQETDQTACPGGKTPMEVSFTEDWNVIFSTKLLGTCFMLLFILNGVFVNNSEEQTWSRLYNTLRFLDEVTPEFRMTGRGYLSLGAFVNCWVIIWSCMDAYVIIGASANPKDLLMDALGLLFVYNLDDIGGDLGFLSEDDWPGLRISWIYEHLVRPCDDTVFDEDKLDCLGTIFVKTFRFTDIFLRVLLVALPVMSVLTPFTQIAPDD